MRTSEAAAEDVLRMIARAGYWPQEVVRNSPVTVLSDLIADIGHLCHHTGLDFTAILREGVAMANYEMAAEARSRPPW